MDLFQKGQNGWPNGLTAKYVAKGDYRSYSECEIAFLAGTTNAGLKRRRKAEAKTFMRIATKNNANVYYHDNSACGCC
jgi:hypothetical protein